MFSGRGGARPVLQRHGLRTAGSESVLRGIAAEGAAIERWARPPRRDQRTLLCTCAEGRPGLACGTLTFSCHDQSGRSRGGS